MNQILSISERYATDIGLVHDLTPVEQATELLRSLKLDMSMSDKGSGEGWGPNLASQVLNQLEPLGVRNAHRLGLVREKFPGLFREGHSIRAIAKLAGYEAAVFVMMLLRTQGGNFAAGGMRETFSSSDFMHRKLMVGPRECVKAWLALYAAAVDHLALEQVERQLLSRTWTIGIDCGHEYSAAMYKEVFPFP